jgi:hypothetical protein
VHGKSEKLVVTLLVMRDFSDLPGASMDCADFHDPTDFSRLKSGGSNIKKPRLKSGAIEFLKRID